MLRVPLTVACLGVLSMVRLATAQPSNPALDQAKEQLADLRFAEAAESLKRALGSGVADPEQTAEIYRLLGQASATLGNPALATEYFRKSLSIVPGTELEAGISPKITEPFAAAKAAAGASGAISVFHKIQPGDPATITLTIESDPMQLVEGVRARYWIGSDSPTTAIVKAVSKSQKISLELPQGTTGAVLAIVDRRGNKLVVIGSDEQPLQIAQPVAVATEIAPETLPPPEVDEPFNSYWLLSGGLTLGLSVLGTISGLTVTSTVDEINRLTADSASVEYGTQIKPLEDKARRSALVSNISFAAAGASAVVTAVLVYRARRQKKPEQPRAVIAPMASENSAGISATLRF